ncbi:hypothetical protein [Agrobacterium vitis]|uniref:hypothetical protein n=1 Tax=Agrobacterium vitis TaxID=373 RepID=UPI003D26901C
MKIGLHAGPARAKSRLHNAVGGAARQVGGHRLALHVALDASAQPLCRPFADGFRRCGQMRFHQLIDEDGVLWGQGLRCATAQQRLAASDNLVLDRGGNVLRPGTGVVIFVRRCDEIGPLTALPHVIPGTDPFGYGVVILENILDNHLPDIVEFFACRTDLVEQPVDGSQRLSGRLALCRVIGGSGGVIFTVGPQIFLIASMPDNLHIRKFGLAFAGQVLVFFEKRVEVCCVFPAEMRPRSGSFIVYSLDDLGQSLLVCFGIHVADIVFAQRLKREQDLLVVGGMVGKIIPENAFDPQFYGALSCSLPRRRRCGRGGVDGSLQRIARQATP